MGISFIVVYNITCFLLWMLSLALYLVMAFVVRLHFLCMDHTVKSHQYCEVVHYVWSPPNASFWQMHGINELCSIWLGNSLMHKYNAINHFCMEYDWVAHTILKFKVLIVFQFFPHRGLDTLIPSCWATDSCIAYESFHCLPLQLVPAVVGVVILGVGIE